MTTAIMEVVIGKLGGALQQVDNQESLLLHFGQDLLWMLEKLTLARDYLQNANQVRSEVVKYWLADVQNIALDTEDIVEECVVQPLYNDPLIVLRYKMKRRFRKLKDRMESILKDAHKYNLLQYDIGQPQPFRSEERKRSGLIERDARPVAIEAKVEQILNLLEDNEVQVIAIVGRGGTGKTFLLQNVYNHPVVRQRFEKTIWLSISQTYSVANLQRHIAFQLGFDVGSNLSENWAAELIHRRLKHMSSLIVLDGMWMADDNLLGRLGIPRETSKPCKVVVTTRSKEVCTSMGPLIYFYQMDLLSEEDSWKLFCLYAFGDDEQNRPPQELEEVAHQVERECGRLPLAIKTVASSMASQKLLSRWESKLPQLKEVSHHQNRVMSILRLSYDALPPVLKLCFLYFSFFGEAVEIDREHLIYLWMGEGLIPEGKEQWDIGLNYLNELQNRSMVEVIQDREFKRTCKIHDLLIDLAISISKENNCAFTVEEASASGCRRILLAKKELDNYDIRNIQLYPSLRTLSLYQNTISKLPVRPFKGVRSLRVIDVSHTHILKLPKFIGNMKLLRVLNLSDTKFAKVPDSVRNLKSLYFLNVGSCPLPEWIGELKCLQHLHGEVISSSRKLSKGLSKLDSLRTLRSDNPSPLVLKDVAKLIHLEELHIKIANEEERTSLEGGVLQPLVNMRHLEMVDESFSGPFPEVMKAMKALERLVLYGFTLPERMWEYGKIKLLELECCCDSRQFQALASLRSLIHLRLVRVRHCKTLSEAFGWPEAFSELRYLEISDCPKLKKLPDLQPGAMPSVEVFIVYAWESVENIPQGFEHRRSLKFIYLTGMAVPDEEKEKLRKGGEYWNRIRDSNPYVTTIIS